LTDRPLTVVLSGGYPLPQVDRLVSSLAPLLELEGPRQVVLDMRKLVGVCPTALALLTAVAMRLSELGLFEEGSLAANRAASRT
jgi:hypothetical protein